MLKRGILILIFVLLTVISIKAQTYTQGSACGSIDAACVIDGICNSGELPLKCSDCKGKGIYSLVKTSKKAGFVGSQVAIDSSALSSPYVTGFLIRTSWDIVEPTEGAYYWGGTASPSQCGINVYCGIDDIINQVDTYAPGKKVKINIISGAATPNWIYTAGSQKLDFIDTSTGSICATCSSPCAMPIPWDNTYITKWVNLVNLFGAKYDSNPTVSSTAVVGVVRVSEEMHLPKNADLCPGGTTWTGLDLDYKNKIKNTWITMTNTYALAFPNKDLMISVQTPIAYSDNSIIVDPIVQNGYNLYGSKFQVQGDFLSETTMPGFYHYELIKDCSTKTVAGFQMLWAAVWNPQSNNRQGDLQASIEKGLRAGASYFEIYEEDIISVDPEISEGVRYAYYATQGEPLPYYSSFKGQTTDFTMQLTKELGPGLNSVTMAVLEKVNNGTIDFDSQTLDFRNLDLEQYVTIDENKIGYDEFNLLTLKDKIVTFTLSNLDSLVKTTPLAINKRYAPKIMVNDGTGLKDCPLNICTITSFSDINGNGNIDTVTFTADLNDAIAVGDNALFSVEQCTLVNGRCETQISAGGGNGYEDGWIKYLASWTKNTGGLNLNIGSVKTDCSKYRSWMDFDISNIYDTSQVYDAKLRFVINTVDNIENRYLSVRSISNGASMGASILAGMIETGKEYTNFIPSLAQTELALISTVEDLETSLIGNSFSIGLMMSDETCTTNNAFATIDSSESAGQEPKLLIYYNNCRDEDSDCDGCIAQLTELEPYANAWLNGNVWQYPIASSQISQQDLTVALHKWVNMALVCP